MPSSNVAWNINGSVAVVTVNRPEARNARVLIIRGSGGALAAGTDITQFREFASGDGGVTDERRLDAVMGIRNNSTSG